MATATFDTLVVAKRLEAKGFPREQAEELARAIGEGRKTDFADLATKHDLALLRGEMEVMRRDLKLELGKMIAVAVGILGGLMTVFKFLL